MVNHSINASITESINESTNESMNQTIQSINQSINQSYQATNQSNQIKSNQNHININISSNLNKSNQIRQSANQPINWVSHRPGSLSWTCSSCLIFWVIIIIIIITITTIFSSRSSHQARKETRERCPTSMITEICSRSLHSNTWKPKRFTWRSIPWNTLGKNYGPLGWKVWKQTCTHKHPPQGFRWKVLFLEAASAGKNASEKTRFQNTHFWIHLCIAPPTQNKRSTLPCQRKVCENYCVSKANPLRATFQATQVFVVLS